MQEFLQPPGVASDPRMMEFDLQCAKDAREIVHAAYPPLCCLSFSFCCSIRSRAASHSASLHSRNS